MARGLGAGRATGPDGQGLVHEASNTSMASVDVDMSTPLVAQEPVWAVSYRKWRLLPMSVALTFTCALPYCALQWGGLWVGVGCCCFDFR